MKYTLFTETTENKFTDIDYENELNQEQYKVVTEADGPSLVLAGAGSGKTRTLVYNFYCYQTGILVSAQKTAATDNNITGMLSC